MKKVVLFFIRSYQFCIRPFIGDNCKFSPTCSKYVIEAIEKHGIIKGAWKAIVRILKCNPWHRGGHDPV